MGCEHVFDDVPGLLDRILGIKTSTSQVYRSCYRASENIDEEQLYSPSKVLSEQLKKPEELVYAMIDGSMLQMDPGWQEVKLGRVFLASQLYKQGERLYIKSSEYVAKRGHYQDFTSEFERLLPPTSSAKQVFITDGADWMHRWIKEKYPNATMILDFFHVAEKLGEAAKLCKAPVDWYLKQKKRLKAGKIPLIIKDIKQLDWPSERELEQLLNYLKKNKDRMHYGHYRKAGLLIGSGPIESAHRTVLQVRMKRSGQRWGEDGADKMIDLRAAVMSGKSHLISSVFSKAA